MRIAFHNNIRQILCITLLLLVITSCSNDKGSGKYEEVYSKEYNEYAPKFSRLIVKGHYDSLAIAAKELFRIGVENKDSTSIIFAGFMVSQAYFFIDNSDSTQTWLDKTLKINEKYQDKKLEMYLNHIKGISKMFRLDYLGALKCFEDGLSVAKSRKDYKMQITFLTNIVNLFYARNDKYGIIYAREMEDVYKEANGKMGASTICMILYSMADMLYLNKEYDEAMKYTRELENLTAKSKIDRHNKIIYLLYADIYSARKENALAEAYYEKAIKDTRNFEPSMILMIHLNYGIHKEKNSRINEAIKEYEKGLAASYQYNLLIYREEFLNRLLKLSLDTHNEEAILKYSKLLMEYKDNLDVNSNEQEFYNLLQSYKNSEYELKIYKNELSLEKMNFAMFMYTSIIILVILTIVFLWFLYRRKLAMYRALFAQYHNSLRRTNQALPAQDIPHGKDMENENACCNKTDNAEKDEKLTVIFSEIENLMQNDKIYKRKDISLELLVSILGKNRDYISKAVNTCSGSSFNNYINMYRISEAVDILSDKDNHILLKELADDLGYSSLAVFSRAFMNRMGCSATSYRSQICNS